MLPIIKEIPKLQISWNVKLKAVITITLVGLVFVAGSGLVGLKTVKTSFAEQKQATDYNMVSVLLANTLLELKLESQNLTTANSDDFDNKLTALSDLASTIVVATGDMNNTDLSALSNRLNELVKTYIAYNKEILAGRGIIGFTPLEGKLKVLYDAQDTMEKASFSMVEDDVITMITGQKGYLITKSEDDRRTLEKGLSNLEAMVSEMGWQDIKIGELTLAYRAAYDDIQDLFSAESAIEAQLQPVFNELKDIVAQQKVILDEDIIVQVTAKADDAQQTATNIMLVAALIVALVILTSLGTIARELNVQLKYMHKFLKKVAEGDFSGRLKTNSNQKDEFTQLKTAANLMVHDISRVIAEVVDGNNTVLNIRRHLEKAVAELAVTSVQVETKTQQSTAATHQISNAVDDVAQRSVGVSETIQSASKSTQTGGKVINECVDSMTQIVSLINETHTEVEDLTQSSTKMLGIIDVINGLADQTNLLALNAAIESARAGEAGRGFSVVADEVRALAQKTVSATTSIGDIIESFNMQSKKMGALMKQGINLTSAGQEHANNARSSFDSIDSSIQKVVGEMDQVVTAVEEISHNTNDIATQVGDICKQSESAKAIRLQLEDYSQQLSKQTKTIANITDRFIYATESSNQQHSSR
ncbi:MAG: methyl-accepting chemotaxis protein [Pseudohongiellaceae bacterium]|jgi:methyl-accepting chemotaxis protein